MPASKYIIKKILPTQGEISRKIRQLVQAMEEEKNKNAKEVKQQISKKIELYIVPLKILAQKIVGKENRELKNSHLELFKKELQQETLQINKNIEELVLQHRKLYLQEDIIMDYKIPQISLLELESNYFNIDTIANYLQEKVETIHLTLVKFFSYIKEEIPNNSIIGKDQLHAMERGFCYSVSFLHSFNNRQKDIDNNFKNNNPTEIMYDVFNQLIKEKTKDLLDDTCFMQKLQIILNYIIPLQITNWCLKSLKDKAEYEQIKNTKNVNVPNYQKIKMSGSQQKIFINYTLKKLKDLQVENEQIILNKFNCGAIQSSDLVDPCKNKKLKEPLKIKKIFNRVDSCFVDNLNFNLNYLKYLIHPGVLIDLISTTKHHDMTKDSAHAMSCYMKHNGEILFYDSNYGDELTFFDLTDLTDYLKDEHKGKYTYFEIFPNNECRLRIVNLNNNPWLQKQIEKGYEKIEEILKQIDVTAPDELFLQEISGKLRNLCQQDLKQISEKFIIKTPGINVPDHQKIKMSGSQQKIFINYTLKKLKDLQVEEEQITVTDVEQSQLLSLSNAEKQNILNEIFVHYDLNVNVIEKKIKKVFEIFEKELGKNQKLMSKLINHLVNSENIEVEDTIEGFAIYFNGLIEEEVAEWREEELKLISSILENYCEQTITHHSDEENNIIQDPHANDDDNDFLPFINPEENEYVQENMDILGIT